MSEDLRKIQQMVRQDRDKLGLSQTEYGQAVGLSQGQVSKIESGSLKLLSVYTARVLTERFGALPELSAQEETNELVSQYLADAREYLRHVPAPSLSEIIYGMSSVMKLLTKAYASIPHNNGPLPKRPPTPPGHRTPDYKAESQSNGRPRRRGRPTVRTKRFKDGHVATVTRQGNPV